MIAFDLDGTLVDSRLDLLQAVNDLRADLALESLSYDDTWPHLCRGMPHLYAHCFPNDSEKPVKLAQEFERIYLANIYNHTKVFAGITDLLNALHTRIPMGVVTNKPQRATEALLSAAGLSMYFDVVVGGDRCEAPKPSPIPLEFAYEQTDRSQRLVMVGDSKGDVTCGRAAGALTVWCQWGYWSAVPEGADHIAAHPAQILEFLNANEVSLR